MDNRIGLIQEDYLDNPWKMMVCCILLNQTSNKQVRPILNEFFGRFPSPDKINLNDLEDVSSIIKTTGFQNIKARRIIDMSKKYIEGFQRPEDLPGIGKYGNESWRIFVKKEIDFIPTDKRLREYIDGIRSDGYRDNTNQI